MTDWTMFWVKTVVHALILSKMDYCNSLLAGSPNYQLGGLQIIQNMACRIVCNLNICYHVMDSMHYLHWLHVKERITYKIASIMCNYKSGNALKYLIDLLPRRNSRTLCSSITIDFKPMLSKNILTMKASFSSVGLRTWNSLPKSVKLSANRTDFKKNLKTHLFGQYYSISNSYG